MVLCVFGAMGGVPWGQVLACVGLGAQGGGQMAVLACVGTTIDGASMAGAGWLQLYPICAPQ